MDKALPFEENRENQLSILLSRLPKELKDLWREKTDEMDTEEAIKLVEKILQDRKIVKEKIFTKIHDIENPELQKEVREVINAIERTFGDTNYFIGNGSVAEVYEMPYAPHVCVKYLVDPVMAREHGNNFREEEEYLMKMRGFSVDGVRVPNVYFYHESDFGTCFGMEKIDGYSLSKIIENPTSSDFVDLLKVVKNQNMLEVISRMKNFITKMHKERKIVHRDLTSRNIMVDKTGNWFVIDFGKAKDIEIGDESTDVSEGTDAPTVENSIRQFYKAIS